MKTYLNSMVYKGQGHKQGKVLDIKMTFVFYCLHSGMLIVLVDQTSTQKGGDKFPKF